MKKSTMAKKRQYLKDAEHCDILVAEPNRKRSDKFMHYTGTIWRPPYEASSLLLEVTAGCTHHSCKFCTLYADLPFPFKMSPLSDIEEDLKEAKAQMKLWKGGVSRTFLTGANPFVLNFSRLMEIAELIKTYFPGSETIGCFARVTDISLKTDEELSALAAAGYDGLTIGIETGDSQALEFMNKGYLSADIAAQCLRLDRAGIGYSFFYLAGISGMGKGEQGARATAGVCNRLHPRIIGVNMLTIYPDSELYGEIQRGNWQEETEIEKYKEIKALVENLNIPVWFGALGASNPVPVQGRLPEDREKVIAVLDTIIEKVGEDELRDYRKNLRHL